MNERYATPCRLVPPHTRTCVPDSSFLDPQCDNRGEAQRILDLQVSLRGREETRGDPRLSGTCISGDISGTVSAPLVHVGYTDKSVFPEHRLVAADYYDGMVVCYFDQPELIWFGTA